MRTMLHMAALAAAMVLVAACSGAGAPAAPAANPTGAVVAAAATTTPTEAPPATPARTPKNVTPLGGQPAADVPTPSPWPKTDGEGAEVVGGRDLLVGLTKSYTEERVNGVGQIRGGQLTQTAEMNDPRVDGTVTFDFSIDTYDTVGSQWGTMRVTNDGGTWEGPCTGGTWAGGNGVAWSCWLTGSGDYAGWTYYRQLTKDVTESVMYATGILYPGEVPAP